LVTEAHVYEQQCLELLSDSDPTGNKKPNFFGRTRLAPAKPNAATECDLIMLQLQVFYSIHVPPKITKVSWQ